MNRDEEIYAEDRPERLTFRYRFFHPFAPRPIERTRAQYVPDPWWL